MHDAQPCIQFLTVRCRSRCRVESHSVLARLFDTNVIPVLSYEYKTQNFMAMHVAPETHVKGFFRRLAIDFAL